MTYSVAIAGASGYVGGELLRLIASHPDLQIKTVTANTSVGEQVTALHPHLRSFENVSFSATTAENLKGHDVVFLALPHTKSAEVSKWLDADQLVIDCGADFRLEDANEWKNFYQTDHAGTWTYGMPELPLATGGKQRSNLAGTKRIAVPGCNVTAITLALAPLAQAGLIDLESIVSVLSVGTSGAGRSPKSNLLASEILGDALAYGVGGTHRHTPEIEQNLRKAANASVKISFTPVLVPMSRGILAVNTALTSSATNLGMLHQALANYYAEEKFVTVLPEGELPRTSTTLGVNTCSIGVAYDSRTLRVTVVSAIDNLVKGTAGAAIQSMNLALGIDEGTGLSIDGVAP